MNSRQYVRKTPAPLPNTHPVSHTAHAQRPVRNLFSLLISTIAECITSATPESPIDGPSEDLNIEMHFAHRWKRLIEERRRGASVNVCVCDDR